LANGGTELEEGKDFGKVFVEVIEEADTPAFNHHVGLGEDKAFCLGKVCQVFIEGDSGDDVALCQQLGCKVAEEMVMPGSADGEILIFVGKAHGHGVAMVLSGPCIDVCVLQDVVAHLSFVTYKYHIALFGCSFGFEGANLRKTIEKNYLPLKKIDFSWEGWLFI
jgi:hypothetical protein